MEYLNKLQSGLKYTVEAGETGRTQVAGMLSPVTSAVGEMRAASDALEGLPFVGPAIGAKLGRVIGAISNAKQQVDRVVGMANSAARGVETVRTQAKALGGQIDRAKASISRLAPTVAAKAFAVVPTASFASRAAPLAAAVSAAPHLLILQPLDPKAQAYHFGLDTAAFDSLQRSTAYRWASQERLTRRPGQQAVGLGDEKLTIKGVIYPGFKGGIKQLDTLRSIGDTLQPLLLITGYGHAMGNWCLTNISEDQEAFVQGGIPRKQGFSLEFVRYGDDLQNS